MTPQEFGKKFEAMAQKVEDSPVDFPPDFGKDSDELIQKHLLYGCAVKLPAYPPAIQDQPAPIFGWHLFFAE